MRILIIKTSALGDIVQTFPVIQFIHKQFPHAIIDWVVEESGRLLVERNELVTRALVVATRRWRKKIFHKETFKEVGSFIKELRKYTYDWVFDLQGNIKSAIFSRLAITKKRVGFDWKNLAEWPNGLITNYKVPVSPTAPIRAQYVQVIEKIFACSSGVLPLTKLCLTPLEREELAAVVLPPETVLVCPHSHWKNKQLSQETWRAFLIHVHAPIAFIYSTPQEEKMVRSLAGQLPRAFVLPKLSLPLLQQVMSQAAQVISVDSLALYLAAEAGVPTFSLFGPSSAALYAPSGPLPHFAVQGSCPYGEKFIKRCEKLRTCLTGACLKDIEPKSIVEAYRQFLHAYRI